MSRKTNCNRCFLKWDVTLHLRIFVSIVHIPNIFIFEEDTINIQNVKQHHINR